MTAEQRQEECDKDLARHHIPIEGEWYRMLYRIDTFEQNLAGGVFKCLETTVKPDLRLMRTFVECRVQDIDGREYELPHKTTQALSPVLPEEAKEYERIYMSPKDHRPRANPLPGLVMVAMMCLTIVTVAYFIWA